MSLAVTILGCGSSGGVPRVGQGWGACDPREPRNRRRRCSALVSVGPALPPDGADPGADAGVTRVLVDTGPDLREQALDVGLDHLDAILMTHAHADHCHGIDDVRPLVLMARRRIAMYMDEDTSRRVRHGFDYIFTTAPNSLYPPLLDEHRVVPGLPLDLEGPGGTLRALPFRVHHGEIDALGFRFGGETVDGCPAGGIAYSPDLNGIPEESQALLRDLDVWIVDALRLAPHPSHFSLAEALGAIDRLRPRRAILTNLHTDMDFAALREKLPPGVEPAHDGMIVRGAG